jgi:hypothetical protein
MYHKLHNTAQEPSEITIHNHRLFLFNTTEHKQLAWHYETTSTFTLRKLNIMELNDYINQYKL